MQNGGYILIISLLNKSDLAILNKRSFKYKLADAEKDYMLAVAAKIIYDSKLRDLIVFKGGTAIHHCYIPQLRLSEDLDFTAIDKSITFEEMKTVLESQDFFEIKKHYISNATIKIERLKYTGPLILPNSLKVETDFLQNVVLPAKTVDYRNVWGVETKIKTMDIREICAEKIRAASDRVRYRDFYDLTLIFQHYSFNLNEIIELMHQKEVRKTISQESIMKNWEQAKKERESELGNIYYSEIVTEEMIEKTISGIKVNIQKGED